MRPIDADYLIKRLNKCDTMNGIGLEPVMAMRDIKALISVMPDAVVRCTGCKHWDNNSGLTARKCDKWNAYTKQFDFCSYAEGKTNADQ